MTTLARLVGIGASHRFTDNRDAISYAGDDWTQKGFRVKGARVGDLQATGATIDIWDEDNTLSTESRATALTGLAGYLYTVELDASGVWVESPEYSQLALEIVQVSGSWPWLTIQIGAMAGWRRSRGLPVGSRLCRKVLAGPYCQYAGVDVSCPRDREHCRLVKLNLANYGGLHFAPDPNQIVNLGPATTKVPASPTGGRVQRPDLGGDSGTEDESGRVRTGNRRQVVSVTRTILTQSDTRLR